MMTHEKGRERRKIMLEMLAGQPSIKVSAFTSKFNVTTKTIRNDLKKLENSNLVTRTFGLASLTPGAWAEMTAKVKRPDDGRERIAAKAIELIPEDAHYIGLDCGPAVNAAAKCLCSISDVKTVVTGSVPAVNILAGSRHQLICPGGVFDAVSRGFQWAGNNTLLDRISLDVTLFSSSGLLNHDGLCADDFSASAMKHKLLQCSTVSIALVPHEAFSATSLVEVAPWSSFDCLITDSELPAELTEKINARTNIFTV